MSVLKSLKGTIVSVQQDISSGIRSLGPKKDKPNTKLRTAGGIDLDAGGELLNCFQNTWTDIHGASEVNAKRAVQVDATIADIYTNLERENEKANELLATTATLPELCKNVDETVAVLESLKTDVELIEQALMQLEDIVEQQELLQNKQRHLEKLTLYSQQKDVSLELAKVRNARQHANKLQAYENKLQQTLRERQQAFQDMYTQEMKNYKLHKTIQLKPSTVGAEASLPLEEICVEEDTKDLDEFLAGTEDSLTDTPMAVGGEDVERVEAKTLEPKAYPAATDDMADSAANVVSSSPTEQIESESKIEVSDEDTVNQAELLQIKEDQDYNG